MTPKASHSNRSFSARAAERSELEEDELKLDFTESVKIAKQPGTATLKDLRPEEKQKIAKVINELTKVTEEKDTLVQEIERLRNNESELQSLKEQNQALQEENERLQKKLANSLGLLKSYQEKLNTKNVSPGIVNESMTTIQSNGRVRATTSVLRTPEQEQISLEVLL